MWLAAAVLLAALTLLWVIGPMVIAELRDVMDEIWLPEGHPLRTRQERP